MVGELENQFFFFGTFPVYITYIRCRGTYRRGIYDDRQYGDARWIFCR
jgi:hypothetical protein